MEVTQKGISRDSIEIRMNTESIIYQVGMQ